MKEKQTQQCPVCKKIKSSTDIISGINIRFALVPFINAVAPEWNKEDNICTTCLSLARSNYIENSLIHEKGELSEAEKEVVEAIRNHEIISVDTIIENDELTFGQKLSDKFAEVGGSWNFIIFFVVVLVLWIGINTATILKAPFDPYPYILLNLVLSCVAALQAPVIMMSQNRREAKDRARAEADYKTNLKAELEIRHLHLKIDQLVTHQWQHLLEIQQIQLDMIKDLKK